MLRFGMTTYLVQSLAKLKEFEGCVPWMYLDTIGRVTVGVGLMLPNVEAALALPFLAAGGQAATSEQIAAEFVRVSGLLKGRSATFYRHGGDLELAEATIEAKLLEVIGQFERSLRAKLPKYDHLPDGVKMALIDMIYNLGPSKLFAQYPKLLQAVTAGDWVQAAEACLRRGPGGARNAWTREQFLSAGVGVIRAEAEILLGGLRRALPLVSAAALAAFGLWIILRRGRQRGDGREATRK